MVTLNVPFVPEGELKSAWQVFRQRERIAQAQERVEGRLRTSGCAPLGPVKRFDSVPQMALRVGGPGLEALWEDPDVKEVREDALAATH